MAHEKFTTEIIHEWLKKYGTCLAIEKAGFASAETCAKYLNRAGIKYKKVGPLPEETKKVILEKYQQYRDNSSLHLLAKELNIKYDSMKVFARKNKLTDKGKNGEIVVMRHKLKGHPMKGVNHTDESKSKIAKSSKKLWAMENSPMRTNQSLQKRSDTQSRLMGNLENKERHSRCSSGWFEQDGRFIFMRSSWEINYAHYLNFLISQKLIIKWEYEVDTFWFEKIKRGVRSYKPDFKVYNNDGSVVYHEVKGWMDAQSKTKLKRMKLYHKDITLRVVGQKEYDIIKKSAAFIPGWGTWIKEKPKAA